MRMMMYGDFFVTERPSSVATGVYRKMFDKPEFTATPKTLLKPQIPPPTATAG